jgi:hypothetical protein
LLQQFSPEGKLQWVLAAAARKQPASGGPGPPATADPAGDLYVAVRSASATGQYVESFSPNGTVRWTSPSLDFLPFSLTLGADGNVYAAGEVSSTQGYEIVGLSTATGQKTGFDVGTSELAAVYAYTGGLAVADGDGSVRYYGYSMVPGAQFALNDVEARAVSSNGGGGTVFMAGFHLNNRQTECVLLVDKVTPERIAWRWSSHPWAPERGGYGTNCGSSTSVAATPDGGVIVAASRSYASTRFYSVEPGGQSTSWSFEATAPHAGAAMAAGPPLVDVNGNVALPFTYGYTTSGGSENSGVGVDFGTQSHSPGTTGQVLLEDASCTATNFGYTAGGDQFAEVGPGALYLGVNNNCTNATGTPPSATLEAFNENGLGMDYQLSAALGQASGTTTGGSGCSAPPQPASVPHFITATPSDGEMPIGGQVTLEVTGFPYLPSGTDVYYAVTGGPDINQGGVVQAQVHPGSLSAPCVPSAYLPITNLTKPSPGNTVDNITATVTVSGKQLTATASIAWVPPVNCNEPVSELGYLQALQCKVERAGPIINDVLETAECALSIGSFFVPEDKIATLLADASDLLALGQDSVAALQAKSSSTGSSAALRLVLDLALLKDQDNNDALSVLLDALQNATTLSDFLHDIADIVSTVASNGSVKQLVIDISDLVANSLGLGSCTTLLGKIVAG